MTQRRWIGRAAVAALIVLAVFAVARYEHTTPDPLRVVLLVGAGVGVISLILDTAVIPEPDWEVETAHPVLPSGQDLGLNRNLRMLENHLTSRTVEPVLQLRLRRLTDDRLARLGLRRGEPGVAELLGPTLSDVIESPPRQLTRATLEECVRRIEELSP
jgi:hypothetical protein